MPGWSAEIANEFIRLAAADCRAFDQMQLQKLVYIAHGWFLAWFDEPLTGDRPEAWEFGPVYTRMIDALAPYGTSSVTREISFAKLYPNCLGGNSGDAAKAELDHSETDTIIMVYQDYGTLVSSQLSSLTQGPGTPWAKIYMDGLGAHRDIPHHMIRDQFVEFAKEAADTGPTP